MLPWLKRWPGLAWLYPGKHIKRWLLLLLAGLTAASLGLAYILVAIYRQQPLPEAFYYFTLQFAPRGLRAVLFLGLGLSLIAVALVQLSRSLKARLVLSPLPVGATRSSVSSEAERQGLAVVALGGGHGLSTLLRGLKYHTDRLTAVVTVADDGGSSGVLRRELGLLPPGDLRDCIAALADAEPLMAQLLQYRFGRGTGLDGHTFGNLFIAAMAGITGDFESAVSEASRVLAVHGRILPSTLNDVVLCAEVRRREPPHDATLVYGQSRIAQAGGVVERVYLQPGQAKGYPEAIRAILHADLIVLGPGSLYTSVLPNLLVADIANAVRASQALKVYVCNVATQPGETDDYTVGDHVRAIREHLGPDFCDYVLANGNIEFQLPPASHSAMVQPLFECPDGCQLVLDDLVDPLLPWRHEPLKLAASLMRLYAAHKHAGSLPMVVE